MSTYYAIFQNENEVRIPTLGLSLLTLILHIFYRIAFRMTADHIRLLTESNSCIFILDAKIWAFLKQIKLWRSVLLLYFNRNIYTAFFSALSNPNLASHPHTIDDVHSFDFCSSRKTKLLVWWLWVWLAQDLYWNKAVKYIYCDWLLVEYHPTGVWCVSHKQLAIRGKEFDTS
jgi:hypothetical protein